MGNYRFRFSDMMPNAWFYKLKNISRTRKQYTSHSMKKNQPSSATSTSQKPHNSQPRYSYYFNTEPKRADKFYNSPINPKASDTRFPDPPRKSSKKRTKRKTIYKPSPRLDVSSCVSAGCSCHATLHSAWISKSNLTHESSDDSLFPLESSPESLLSESDDDEFAPPPPQSFDQLPLRSTSCNCKVRSSKTDIIIDMDNNHHTRNYDQKIDDFDTISELELPPILTKPEKFNDRSTEVTKVRRSAERSVSVKIVKEESFRTQKKDPKANSIGRRSSVSPAGIKLRANSPRIASKKIQAYARKSVSSSNSCLKSKNKTISESFAIIKSSLDPQRDFRDSMMEMIVENNIRAAKDLEDLLACYLTLNSNEYHDLIIKAFEQIWIQMTDLRL